MKELDLEISKGGFIYKQVFKNAKGYIYSQDRNGIFIGYESFLRMENTQYNCVSFPGNEAFGKWAWSTQIYEKALSYING